MAETVKNNHPVRGVLWGLMMGIGLAFVLVFTKVIFLDLTTMIIVVVATMIVGVLWGLFGPAKKPKGEPPVPRVRPTAPEPTRFDDDEFLAPADTGEAVAFDATPAAGTTVTTVAPDPEPDPGPAGESGDDEN